MSHKTKVLIAREQERYKYFIKRKFEDFEFSIAVLFYFIQKNDIRILQLPNISLMIKQFFRLSIVLALLLSCKKDASKPKITLFSNDYKNLQLSSGFKNNSISINGADWSVEYVKDAASGKAFLDQAGQTVALKTSGSVELQNGWLKLERKQADDQLILSLKENLSANPRKFLIGILADGNRDELSIAQTRGQGYAIVKKKSQRLQEAGMSTRLTKVCIQSR